MRRVWSYCTPQSLLYSGQHKGHTQIISSPNRTQESTCYLFSIHHEDKVTIYYRYWVKNLVTDLSCSLFSPLMKRKRFVYLLLCRLLPTSYLPRSCHQSLCVCVVLFSVSVWQHSCHVCAMHLAGV